jgi:hypothetical protein
MKLEIGGKPHNGIYIYITILSKGEHTYYFTASDGTDTVISDEFKTPNIDGQQIEKGEEEVNIFLIGLIVVAIIIVILITLFLILHRRKKKEDESSELDKIHIGMTPVPNIYPAVLTQDVPVEPQLVENQIQAPLIQPTQTLPYDTPQEYFTLGQSQPIQYQIQAPLNQSTQTLPYDTTQDCSIIGQPQQIEYEQPRELVKETPEQQNIDHPDIFQIETLEQPEAEVMQGDDELIEE